MNWGKQLIGPYYYGSLPYRLWRARRAAAVGRAPVMIVYYHRVAEDAANSWTVLPTGTVPLAVGWIRHRTPPGLT